MTCRRVAGAAAVAIALVASGCGGDDDKKADKPKTTPTTETTGPNKTVPPDAVANVGDEQISKETYEHWLELGGRQQGAASGKAAEDALRDQTMQFVISAEWLLQESEQQGVSATDAEVRESFEQQREKSYPKEADYRRFLKDSGQTEEDRLYRVELALLADKLRGEVTGDGSAKEQEQALNDFVKDFQKRWRALTWCAEDYVVDQCANGEPAPATPTLPAPPGTP
jgi:hypothetical protein